MQFLVTMNVLGKNVLLNNTIFQPVYVTMGYFNIKDTTISQKIVTEMDHLYKMS